MRLNGKESILKPFLSVLALTLALLLWTPGAKAQTADDGSAYADEEEIGVDTFYVWSRHSVYVKTNALAWACAITNVEVELRLAMHWSVNMPVQYSAWNYGTSRRKFRTLSFFPGARYWLSPDNNGVFFGAHFGIAQYNVATKIRDRIQDHNGHNPALGGGLSVGYRLPLKKNDHWNFEINAGAGIYALYFDRFHNEKNGLRTSTERRTFWGLDQLSLSVAYRFDTNW